MFSGPLSKVGSVSSLDGAIRSSRRHAISGNAMTTPFTSSFTIGANPSFTQLVVTDHHLDDQFDKLLGDTAAEGL